VQHENRAVFDALVKQTGHEDHPPDLYWESTDFTSLRAATGFAKRNCHPGATVQERYGFEEGAPGCWDWSERQVWG
jgi:hypothetical protein